MMRGSPLTAEGRLRKLGRFCKMHQTTPAQDRRSGYKGSEGCSGHAGRSHNRDGGQQLLSGYIEDHINTVKSWFRYFDVEIKRRVKVASNGFSLRYRTSVFLTCVTCRRFYDKADLRESVMISLMAKSGLRPGVIGNYNGTDGLQMRDLPDIIVCCGTAKCIRTPNRIVVRPQVVKGWTPILHVFHAICNNTDCGVFE